MSAHGHTFNLNGVNLCLEQGLFELGDGANSTDLALTKLHCLYRKSYRATGNWYQKSSGSLYSNQHEIY